MKETIERLMRHARWADAQTLTSLRAVRPVPDDAVQLFAHVVTTERIYLSRIRGEDPFPQEFWPPLTLDEAAQTAFDVGDALVAFAREAGEAPLREPVRYRNSRGTYFETPRGQLLTHLALHGEHHRGQIARLVREAGGDPAVTDFIAFVRKEAPSQRQSAGEQL